LLPHTIVAWFDAEFEWADPHLIASLDIANGAVKQLMNAVISELKRPGFASAAMIELLTAQICLTLARHFDNIDSGRLSGGLAPWRMRRIDEFLRANLGTATISELAEHCELSARHLSRAFQVSYGRSLGRHLTMLRVNLAREMLANGAAIKATAFAVGFAGPTNFATAFRRATGTTPREYRDIQKSSRSVQ
jgi:AraC family transcriptional regulator